MALYQARSMKNPTRPPYNIPHKYKLSRAINIGGHIRRVGNGQSVKKKDYELMKRIKSEKHLPRSLREERARRRIKGAEKRGARGVGIITPNACLRFR